MPVPLSSHSLLIFKREYHVHGESSLRTEPTTLSPSKSQPGGGEGPPTSAEGRWEAQGQGQGLLLLTSQEYPLLAASSFSVTWPS